MMRNNSSEFDPESAIIDAELLVKYRMVNRAIEALERAIDNLPRHIGLREKLREILIDAGRRDQAAQQCLALASLHMNAGDMERANERLLEAKRLDPRVSVTGPLRDVRTPKAPDQPAQKILSGNLSDVNLFDIIQIIENSRLSGVLLISAPSVNGELHLTEGLIVGAQAAEEEGMPALQKLLDSVDGTFEFEKSSKEFERTIKASSNTALILDMLRAKDEENQGLDVLDSF
jgi:tetratricopeptide (TPR) repeat protein